MNRSEAVAVLEEILFTGCIHFPNIFSLDPIKDSTNYKVSIKPQENDKPTLKRIILCFGLTVNEEEDTLVIF